MKYVYEVVVTTTSGLEYSHYFSSRKKAIDKQKKIRNDWVSKIVQHQLDVI